MVAEALQRAQMALTQGRWADARDEFESVLQVEQRPDAVQGLGEALWWLGDASGCLRACEKAYAMFREAGCWLDSAVACIWLSVLQLKSLGNRAACSGWIATAARLVERGDIEAVRGWVLWARSSEETDPRTAQTWAEHALAMAREGGDRDLELCALSELGKCLVVLGQSEAGMPLIDEAMAAALGGEYQSRETVVSICCSMMGACDQAADLQRATQWCRAADRFMQTYGSPFLFADCRRRYGSVLLATGHWAAAERELQAVLMATTADTDYFQQALARLAQLRLRQGRSEEAESLLQPIRDRTAGLVPLATLHHRRGEHEIARKLLERYLLSAAAEPVDRADALDQMVSVELAQGNLDRAAELVGRLADLTGDGSNPRLAAHHAFAAARTAFASGSRPDAVVTRLEEAMAMFSSCDLPYETSQARLELARALGDQSQVAVAEAQGAFATFERLGAVADADAAAQLIRSLGGTARTGPKGARVLTKRETEVLRLLAGGLSNPEIAERLYVSRKTASHHVSSILNKLGLRNRAEAAVHADRVLNDLLSPEDNDGHPVRP